MDDISEVAASSGDEEGVKSFLGKNLGELVSGWMAAFAPWEVKSYPGTGKIKACRYYTSKPCGIQLCFDQQGMQPPSASEGSSARFEMVDGSDDDGWVLSAVHLFNAGTDGFERFLGPLPHALNFDMLNAEVVKLLGEPTSKGGHSVPVWIEYSQYGLQVTFRGFAFEDRENPVASITLFPLAESSTEAFN